MMRSTSSQASGLGDFLTIQQDLPLRVVIEHPPAPRSPTLASPPASPLGAHHHHRADNLEVGRA